MSCHENWLQRFHKAGAIWEYQAGGPHAAYEMASRHSDFYFNTDIAVSDPQSVHDIGMVFTRHCQEAGLQPDWVVSYSAKVANGLILAAKTAELLTARFGYVDLRDNISRFSPAAGQSVLMVTDDIHSGKSLDRMANLIEGCGGTIAPVILTLGNFSGATSYRGAEIFSLFDRAVTSWSADECPLCAEGSHTIPARQNWRDLTESAMS